MKIRLLGISPTNEKYLQEGIDMYAKRIERYNPFDIDFLPALKKAGNLSEARQNQKEGELLLKKISADETVVLLDQGGKRMDSVQFAEHIDKLLQRPAKSLTFVIGGAYGFSEAVYQRADESISCSPMTLSHQVIRVVFLEQLYRAFTILRNEPYHH